jgi:hypothetical protein
MDLCPTRKFLKDFVGQPFWLLLGRGAHPTAV